MEQFYMASQLAIDKAKSDAEAIKATYARAKGPLLERLKQLEHEEAARLQTCENDVRFAMWTVKVICAIRLVESGCRVICDDENEILAWEEEAKREGVDKEVVAQISDKLASFCMARASLRARKSGEAQGYNARESYLIDFDGVEVQYVNEKEWTPCDKSYYHFNDFSAPFVDCFDLVNDEFGCGHVEIEHWHSKECRVSGYSNLSCSILKTASTKPL